MGINQNLIECSVCGNKISEKAIYDEGYHFCCDEHYREWKLRRNEGSHIQDGPWKGTENYSGQVRRKPSNPETKAYPSKRTNLTELEKYIYQEGADPNEKIQLNSYHYITRKAYIENQESMEASRKDLQNLQREVQDSLKKVKQFSDIVPQERQNEKYIETKNNLARNNLKKYFLVAAIFVLIMFFLFY